MSRHLILLFFFLQLIILALGQTAGLTTENARIAFITPEGQVATISADASDMRILSETQTRYQFPAWSPDGSVIASLGDDGSSGVIDLFTDVPEVSENRIYTSTQERPFYMYWSPDAELIGFLALSPESGLAMNILDVESQVSRARAFGNPFFWQWSNDSSRLLIHQGLIDGQVGFLDTDSDDKLAENLAETSFFRSPGISPSGDYIAYSVSSMRGNEIILEGSPFAKNDVSEISRSLTHKGFTAMSWSPVQDNLAFILPKQENMSSFGPLAMMDAESGLLEDLTDESAIAFFWSPDGKYIMYLTAQRAEGNDFAQQYDIFRSATVEEYITESYLAQSDEIELAVNIVDIATLESRYLTSIRPTVLFINQFVPYFEQYALSHNVWSPDSQAVTLPIRDEEGNSNIAVIYIEDGQLDVIAEGAASFWQH